MTDLGTLGGSNSVGNALNNLGQVTGSSGAHAFLYTDGQMQDLGTLGSGLSSRGLAINDQGQVTGYSYTDESFTIRHAFLYSEGQVQDLGTLGGNGSQGYGINNQGQVVGSSDTCSTASGNIHAFLYSDGQMQDLNDLIDPTLSITLTNAKAINDNGQIVTNAGGRAYLLTPVPPQDQAQRSLTRSPSLGASSVTR